MKKILITGTGGFIGSYLYNRLGLPNKGDVVVGVDRKSQYTYSNHPAVLHTPPLNYTIKVHCELENKQWVNRLLSELDPDVIFHFAGCATASSSLEKIWKSNVDTTVNLLNGLSGKKSVEFILASSIMAEFPSTVYGASKMAVENLLEGFSHQNQWLQALSVRFCAVAGAGNTHGAVRDIVRKFIQNETPQLLGNSPGSVKPYLYINDLLDSILALYNNQYYNRGPVTIVPNDIITIDEIAKIIKGKLNSNKNYKFSGEYLANDQAFVIPNTDMMMEKFLSKRDIVIPSSAEAVGKAVDDILAIDYKEYMNA